jgi:hypothetical protein
VDSSLLRVSADGEVTAGLLPEPFGATLTATAGTHSGTALLTVHDTDPDNYGDYAGDGLPDAWQILFFGFRNPSAAPGEDPDGDGQDNESEWLGGTDPTDRSSALWFAVRPGPRPPGTITFLFRPYLPDRTYTLEWSDALADPWTPLPGAPTDATEPGEGMITDPAATEARKLYRLRVGLPVAAGIPLRPDEPPAE